MKVSASSSVAKSFTSIFPSAQGYGNGRARRHRFRAQGDAPAKIAELAKESFWARGSVVEKSGYALMPGSKTTDSDVARACGELLATPPTPKT